MRWFRHYFIALIVVLVLAGTYRVSVQPLLQPPDVTPVKMADLPVLRSDESLSELFPEGAWQRGTCKRLQTSEGMLLFDRWEQTAEAQWKLWPITIIIGRRNNGGLRHPILIESYEGAEIQFADSFDVRSEGAPPIQRGRIIGDVRIHSHASSVKSTDASSRAPMMIDIRTANVGIDNRKIWTTDAIQMQIGDAQLLGRDLTIHLASAGGVSGNASRAGDILDRMDLVYLDRFTMPVVNRNSLVQTLNTDDTATNANATPSGTPPVPAVVAVECAGSVEYDFALDRTSLVDDVKLSYQVPGMEADQFVCQTLELSLRDPMNSAIARNGPLDWLMRVKATGLPAGPAFAKLPSMGLEVAAEEINFDAISGLLQASGSTGVHVKFGNTVARLAGLGYQFSPSSPTTLGAIDAFGAGYVKIDDPALALKQLSWRDSFKMQPLQSTDANASTPNVELWIDGEVTAVLADGGKFHADAVRGELSSRADANRKVSYFPKEFQAVGSVHLDSAVIFAATDRLNLRFSADETGSSEHVSPATPGTNDVPGMRQWVSQPKTNPDGTIAPVARPRPKLRGDTISANLRLEKGGVSAKALQVVGKVEVLHTIQTGTVPLDAKLRGEQLVLRETDDVLQLSGTPLSPARFDVGDGYFVGPQIQVRPRDNIVWIDSAGEFQMPSAVLPAGLTGDQSQTKQASRIHWTQSPLCRWQGEMIFDGRTAVLTEGVDIVASMVHGVQPWDVRLKGDRMEILLDQDVQVREIQTLRQATVQSISLLQSDQRPVMAEAYQRDAEGTLLTRHLMSAPKLSLMPSGGGKFIGDGPGWYRYWAVSNNKTTDSPARATPLAISNSDGLDAVHLSYHDSMQGDLTAKSLEFVRGVRVAHRTVKHWDDVFDCLDIETVNINESILDGDRLRFGIDPNQRSVISTTAWEMEATGGLTFQSRNDSGLLVGRADRFSYSSQKDVFTIFGNATQPAIIRKQHPNGQTGPELRLRSGTINRTTLDGEMVLEGFTIGNLNQEARSR